MAQARPVRTAALRATVGPIPNQSASWARPEALYLAVGCGELCEPHQWTNLANDAVPLSPHPTRYTKPKRLLGMP